MNFTIEDIVLQFDPATFARGEAYARPGMVIDTLRGSDVIEGEADGRRSGGIEWRIRIA